METCISHHNQTYKTDLSKGIDITIPAGPHGQHPVCFYAPGIKIEAVVADSFIGDIAQGGSVNFKNITINPHGNGTHTECCGHIIDGPYFIGSSMECHHFVGLLISVVPDQIGEDRVILPHHLENVLSNYPNISALVIRTYPNTDEKCKFDYSDTNPPYLDHTTMSLIVDHGIDHLIVDLPSVDRESDGAAFAAHKIFWNIGSKGEQKIKNTITELVYIDNDIKDGLYLCGIFPLRMMVDASPSRILLYTLTLTH